VGSNPTAPTVHHSLMLIHKHDAPLTDAEWRDFLKTHDFGELIVPGVNRDLPVVVPTHFVYDGDKTVLLHLAAINPVWEAIAERPRALLSVFGAYTYIPGHWNQDEYGVPTSYYAAVQLACDVEPTNDDAALAAILERQLDHFQPEGKHAPVEPGDNPYGKRLSAIRGLRLTVTDVRAKFKFGANRTVEHRQVIAEKLAERATPLDIEAKDHLERRLPRQ
jgi:transcriptional regulator